MPITDGVPFDLDGALLDYYVRQVRADDSAYRQRVDEQRAAEQEAARLAAAKEANRQRLREIARLPRTKKPGSRPWQTAGFATRQAWVDAGSPEPVIPPSKRELIEQAIRVGERKKHRITLKRKHKG